jgi:hypothetical protein
MEPTESLIIYYKATRNEEETGVAKVNHVDKVLYQYKNLEA